MAHPWHSANHIYLWMTIHCILVLFINVTLSILFLSFYNLQRWHCWCFPCQVTGRNIAIVSLCQPMENKMKVNLKDFNQKYIHMCLSDTKWNLYKKIRKNYLIQVRPLYTLVTDSCPHSLTQWRNQLSKPYLPIQFWKKYYLPGSLVTENFAKWLWLLAIFHKPLVCEGLWKIAKTLKKWVLRA